MLFGLDSDQLATIPDPLLGSIPLDLSYTGRIAFPQASLEEPASLDPSTLLENPFYPWDFSEDPFFSSGH
ncbi:hypothetical protein J7T55_014780 [Diaporthe amygdali]|uniref:uncharacterized protein n=1 Tax=Phomopsis amygdali TaxID=1214568 RepID=UPI0022FF30E8|nr:uncharacterized protein J7T55_014780 [Diaporthe amygdali]KAJ0109978.1 hypothetical protein J7T55_014780 [Diaporthe amygdali]